MKKYWVMVAVGFVLTAALYADSLNCREIGSWPFGPYCNAVALDPARNLAFMGAGGGVYILNVSNPSSPVKVSEAIHTRGVVYGLYYEANRLYIAGDEAGLEIWDVRNPEAPAMLGSYDTPGSAYGVAVSGNYAYVADEEAGLRVISIADPANPNEVGYYDTPGYAYGVAVSGNYVYVADWEAGLRVVSIADPANPKGVGYYDTPDDALGVAVSGNYAYVADAWAGLRVIEFYGTGIEERLQPAANRSRLTATIVRNVLELNTVSGHRSSVLLDVTGRKVLELKSGDNDVRHLSPGVYFIQIGSLIERNVVITK